MHMKFPRFSLASIGFVILVLAIDFAVIRVAFRSFVLEGWATFAFLLLPMLDAILVALYRLRQRGRRTFGAIGFLVTGTVATLAVFVSCVIAPEMAIDMLRAIGRPIAMTSINGLTRLFGNAVMQQWGMQLTLGVVFEILLPMAFFCSPPLLIAILGGWLTPRLGPGQRIASARLGGKDSRPVTLPIR
jgi:hypothetical protein